MTDFHCHVGCRRSVFLCILLVICVGTELSAADEGIPKEVQFNRDVRPILSENCFQCHGPDVHQRQAELRLDSREGAIAEHDGGKAVVPGDVKASRLVQRIISTVADERMPPEKTGRKLTQLQIETLRRWIEQGAKYEQHWSLIAPRHDEPPQVKDAAWLKNPIDRFVLARLQKEGLAPSPAASKETLLRRVSLDLTGLPPTPEEREAFLADDSPQAYEKVVDRLLNSPRYGERMAMHWLDLARYADTNGYNNDEDRTQWMWRDWVIDAFNRNQPYDQFIAEQLAGDLLPNSTSQQKIATAFNRNHVLTTEGGIIDEEYRVEYVADRVHTTATVFLGLSMQCARCHDHKFDPLTQRDYYSFFAFFNNLAEKNVGYNQAKVAEPFIKVATREQQVELDQFATRKTELERKRTDRAAVVDADLEKWEREILATGKLPVSPEGLVHAFHFDEAKGNQISDALDAKRNGVIAGNAKWSAGKLGGALEFDGQTFVPLGEVGAFEQSEAISISAWINLASHEASTVLSKMDEANSFRGYDLIIEQGRVASHIVHHWPDNGLKVIAKDPLPLNSWHHIAVTYDGKAKGSGVAVYIDGKPQPVEITTDSLSGKDTIKTDKPFHLGRRTSSAPFRGMLDEFQLYRKALSAAEVAALAQGQAPAGIADILKTPITERTAAQKESLKRYYLENVDETSRMSAAELGQIEKKQAEVEKSFPATMIMQEMPTPRQAFVLSRGQYDQPGASVNPGVPASLPPLQAGVPANRLALAKWLVDPAHPLTARVAVNRWWQLYFGTGIVETVEDFGSQGAWPSHPELLDWLATEFIRGGWNVKEMQRLIVTSATYRQASRVSPAMLERDPKNRLLARGPRFRLPAETVRDNALAISGLLKEKIGGPSVKPYQPDGLWQDVSVERRAVYKQDEGDGLYRRGMYTFWKRTCPPPGMMTFDAPDRETCTIRRARTNTPLQALVLMNDPTYLEASRKLAERVLKNSGDNDKTRLAQLYRLVLCRDPHAGETATLLPLLGKTRERFKAAPEKAKQLLKIGDSPRDEKLDAGELAAWTTLCSLVLNLDEAITKE
jgi:hypothetical protein